MPEEQDKRSTQQVVRQYERMQTIKQKLVRAGQLDGDATLDQVVQKLREIVPIDLMV